MSEQISAEIIDEFPGTVFVGMPEISLTKLRDKFPEGIPKAIPGRNDGEISKGLNHQCARGSCLEGALR